MLKNTYIFIFIYALAVILAGIFWQQPYILLTAYIVISAAMLKKWHTKEDLFYYFVAFLFGSLGEIVASYLGAWTYSKPLFYIPIWLPFLWGIAVLALIKLAQSLIKK